MLAFALSIVMLVLYRVYVVKEQPPEPKKAATAAATAPCQPTGSAQATPTGARPLPPNPPPTQLCPYCRALRPKTSWWKTSSTA